MNIGAGIILLLFSLIIFAISFLSKKRSQKIFFIFLSIGSIFIILSLLLITGLYDPYSDHIR
jgi:hypothetical protein